MTDIKELSMEGLAELAFDAGMFYQQTSLLPDGNEGKNLKFDAWWLKVEPTIRVRLNSSGEATTEDVAWAAFEAGVSYWQTHILADGNRTKALDFDPWWAQVMKVGQIPCRPSEAHIWEHLDLF